MGFGLVSRIKHAWNMFVDQKVEDRFTTYGGMSSYGGRLDRTRLRSSNERSIISSIMTRLSIDAASVNLKHVRVDSNNRYLSEVSSGLNYCLNVEGNIDQAGRHLRQDIFMTMLDKGVAAIVPVDTSLDPTVSASYDIKTLRVGEVTAWYQQHVTVNVYNERRGMREDITLPKTMVGIVENPFYLVMNERNSTLQRLIHKLNILDAIDEQSGSGKLDLIIQLPYVIKSEARRTQAEQRRKDIEFQLSGSKYGIAYTDGTERITQLNRPAENNLLKQIEYLTTMLYSQLGLTVDIMNGTADPKAMVSYQTRTIETLVNAVVEAMHRTFLTRTARSQGQAIMAFADPFKHIPLDDMADIIDKLSRNEVLTPNEFRQYLGIPPSLDPRADKLQNSNMPIPAVSNPSKTSPALDKRWDSIAELVGNSQNGS